MLHFCDVFYPCLLRADFAYDLVPYLAEQTFTRLSVSLTSGLVAGVCAAIVSQPGGVHGLALSSVFWPFVCSLVSCIHGGWSKI